MAMPKAWSVSAAQQFEACPKQFWFQRVEGVPVDGPKPTHVLIGIVAHAGLEAAWRYRKASKAVGPMDDTATWEMAKAGIAESWLAEFKCAPVEKPIEWGRIMEMVDKVLVAESESYDQILDVEHKFFFRAGMNVIAYADLLRRLDEHTIHIRDWKSRSRPSKPEDLVDDFQLGVYAEAARRSYDWVETVMASHYYPPIATEVMVEISPERSAAALSRLRAVKEMATHETEWPTVRSARCAQCPYQPICPAWQDDDTNRLSEVARANLEAL